MNPIHELMRSIDVMGAGFRFDTGNGDAYLRVYIYENKSDQAPIRARAVFRNGRPHGFKWYQNDSDFKLRWRVLQNTGKVPSDSQIKAIRERAQYFIDNSIPEGKNRNAGRVGNKRERFIDLAIAHVMATQPNEEIHE